MVRKVVYNRCFGGFAISRECAQWLADRGNKECIDMLNEPCDEPSGFYGNLYDTPRHDALLVMAVEHLGTEKASGGSSELSVHELQSDRYYIDEYDGSESVVEPHTINWIEV